MNSLLRIKKTHRESSSRKSFFLLSQMELESRIFLRVHVVEAENGKIVQKGDKNCTHDECLI